MLMESKQFFTSSVTRHINLTFVSHFGLMRSHIETRTYNSQVDPILNTSVGITSLDFQTVLQGAARWHNQSSMYNNAKKLNSRSLARSLAVPVSATRSAQHKRVCLSTEDSQRNKTHVVPRMEPRFGVSLHTATLILLRALNLYQRTLRLHYRTFLCKVLFSISASFLYSFY